MSKYILVQTTQTGTCALGAHFSASGFVFYDYRTQLDRSVSLTRAHAPIRVKARTGRIGAVCANAWASMYFDNNCIYLAKNYYSTTYITVVIALRYCFSSLGDDHADY